MSHEAIGLNKILDWIDQYIKTDMKKAKMKFKKNDIHEYVK
jgi:hypothetical protein